MKIAAHGNGPNTHSLLGVLQRQHRMVRIGTKVVKRTAVQITVSLGRGRGSMESHFGSSEKSIIHTFGFMLLQYVPEVD